jgi:hypothetical protein
MRKTQLPLKDFTVWRGCRHITNSLKSEPEGIKGDIDVQVVTAVERLIDLVEV